ncbi:MAG: hypothetical protein ACJ79R_15010 [Anaeromyxobacteraceae bacterium]
MKRLALLFALALSAVPALARAQVGVQIHVGLPVAPPLVVVQPGVQVVENYDEEVFFTNGWYWCRRDTGWYRSRTPRAAFAHVEPRYVPRAIYRLPPGQYKHWRRAEARAERHERRDDRHAWKEHEKAERREWKEERRHEKHAEHEREHGHGHGHD